MIPYIVVTGTWPPSGGTDPPTGAVIFTPTGSFEDPADREIVPSKKVYAGLNQNGQMAQALAANDFAGATPSTTQWRVEENILGATSDEYYVTVPSSPPDSRTVTDIATTQGVVTIESATAGFTDDDIGKIVWCSAGVAVGATILEVVDSTHAMLSNAPTISGSGATAIIGAQVDLTQLRPS